PAQAIAPANIGQPRQPTQSAALGIARGYTHGIQGLEGTVLGTQLVYQIPEIRDQRCMLMAQQAVKLAVSRQVRESRTQMPLRIAVRAPLAAKDLPLAEEGQREHLRLA